MLYLMFDLLYLIFAERGGVYTSKVSFGLDFTNFTANIQQQKIRYKRSANQIRYKKTKLIYKTSKIRTNIFEIIYEHPTIYNTSKIWYINSNKIII